MSSRLLYLQTKMVLPRSRISRRKNKSVNGLAFTQNCSSLVDRDGSAQSNVAAVKDPEGNESVRQKQRFCVILLQSFPSFGTALGSFTGGGSAFFIRGLPASAVKISPITGIFLRPAP